MSIGEQLREKRIKEGKSKLLEEGERKQAARERHREKREEIDWKELMGQYQPTYKRGKGGAIRRK